MVDVEARVNDLVMADLGVHAEIMTQEEAVRSGAMALFGEKYGDQVRVVSVGDWARELCGGTHAHRSGQLGVVKLLGESSIGSGVRRVEALVGGDAYRFLAREHVLVAQLSEALKVRPEQLPERVNDIVDRLRTAEKEIEQVRLQQLLASAGQLVDAAEDLGGVSFVGHHAEAANGGDARTLALDVRGRMPADRPAVAAVIGSAQRQALGRGGRQRRRARDRRSRPTRWCARPRRCSAARAAARTTSPRAVAPTRPRRARPSPRSAARCRASRWPTSSPAYASGWIPATPGSGSRAATPRASWPRPWRR